MQMTTKLLIAEKIPAMFIAANIIRNLKSHCIKKKTLTRVVCYFLKKCARHMSVQQIRREAAVPAHQTGFFHSLELRKNASISHVPFSFCL